MKRFQEIIPVSALLDDELNAVRGGASDQTVVECLGGKKGDLECSMGKITLTEVKELIACP
jgi:hypothetical protein